MKDPDRSRSSGGFGVEIDLVGSIASFQSFLFIEEASRDEGKEDS